MRVRHLGLPVRDERRSREFYATHFGFGLEGQRYEDGTVIVRDAEGFDLALHTVAQLGDPPPFLHFGFRLTDPDEVRALRTRLVADGVQIIEWDDGPDMVSFKCLDPDGHRVEVYWEP